MIRQNFQQNGMGHAARLWRVTKRSVANKNLALVRLEFEVFDFREQGELRSTAQIVCRDVIVGVGANAQGDPGVERFSDALTDRCLDTAKAWLELPKQKERPWVEIHFGEVDPTDQRNLFDGIERLVDAGEYNIVEYRCDLSKDWFTVPEAANTLGKSEKKVRHTVDRYEKAFGLRLVWRPGPRDWRRVNMCLLRNLMTRYEFPADRKYAARLCKVTKRPVENKTLALVRLEFEVYRILKGRKLSPTGQFACRDVIVGVGADAQGDQGVERFRDALTDSSPGTVEDWLALQEKKPWVKVCFGKVDPIDERYPITQIGRFVDAEAYEITRRNHYRAEDWDKISAAATVLNMNIRKTRRELDRYEKEYGSELVQRNPGNQRLINIPLLEKIHKRAARKSR